MHKTYMGRKVVGVVTMRGKYRQYKDMGWGVAIRDRAGHRVGSNRWGEGMGDGDTKRSGMSLNMLAVKCMYQ